MLECVWIARGWIARVKGEWMKRYVEVQEERVRVRSYRMWSAVDVEGKAVREWKGKSSMQEWKNMWSRGWKGEDWVMVWSE